MHLLCGLLDCCSLNKLMQKVAHNLRRVYSTATDKIVDSMFGVQFGKQLKSNPLSNYNVRGIDEHLKIYRNNFHQNCNKNCHLFAMFDFVTNKKKNNFSIKLTSSRKSD